MNCTNAQEDTTAAVQQNNKLQPHIHLIANNLRIRRSYVKNHKNPKPDCLVLCPTLRYVHDETSFLTGMHDGHTPFPAAAPTHVQHNSQEKII
jgi:hypothetical protein